MGRFWIYWTYHKDSYMAHRREWKTGYEGRYRRTQSPSASDRNLFHNQRSPNAITTTTSPLSKKPAVHTKMNGNLRSAVSTSSLLQRSPSPLDNDSSRNNSTNENSLNNNNEVFSVNRNNEWTSHLRQVSTTVNFTTEELRAFMARKKVKDLAPSTADYSSCDADMRPLTRAVSMGETLHHCDVIAGAEEDEGKEESLCREVEDNAASPEVSLSLDSTTGSDNVSSPADLSHDGPITAHPATVTEEYSNPTSPVALSPATSVESSASCVTYPTPVTSLVSSVSLSTPNIAAASVGGSSSGAKVAYHRSLSGTCPSMTSDFQPEDENIVVLGYGRTPNSVEVSCNQLGQEFVRANDVDSKLFTLLAPDSGYKSAGSYMEGVFALELRRDLLNECHAEHPDLKRTSTEPSDTFSNKAPLTADSAYFTTSEGKAKLLSTFREKRQSPIIVESQFLTERKDKLMASISKKLEILRTEHSAIQEEMVLNGQLGTEVSAKVESRSTRTEFDKYKLHVSEIDKITSLLLGLSGRLARVENALLTGEGSDDRKILEAKKEKLEDQLEEAKKLKENIDRRAVQVARVVAQYLVTAEYADYDHFIKMKAKLLMDTKEIHDKISLGQEQLVALENSSSSSP